MAQQVNLFFLLFGALQGGLLSLWFFKNRRQESANLYISLFLLVVGLQLTLKVIAKVWLYQHVLWLYMLSYQLPYLIGPLLYLYVKSKVAGRRQQADGWHFLLFGLAAIWMSAQYATNGFLPEFHPYSRAFFQTLSLGTYTWLAYRIANPALKTFLRVAASAEQIVIITLALMMLYYGRFPDVRLLFMVLTLLIYWVSYQVIAQTNPFSPTSSVVPPLPVTPLPNKRKYARSSLKPAEADRIEQALGLAMRHDKLFLDSSLTIDSLAEKVATSRHHLSQVLNERLQQSYTDYLSTHRLEEARQRLENSAYSHYTIAAIAFDSGFNSLASFNDVFRKQYGTTPSKFRESFIKKQHS